jgi:serine/threonine-protein kinase PpkA
MPLLPGGDLKSRIRKGLSPGQALEILEPIASALAYAHAKGFVHRDIKPENILFNEHGWPILTDLGIAKVVGSDTRLTGTGMSIGTPHYMSPEQARGQEVDGRTDIYSLGVVFYEMLTGQVPYRASDSFAVALKHINDPVPQLPVELNVYQGILDNMLAKEPDQRYPGGEVLIEQLNGRGGLNVADLRIGITGTEIMNSADIAGPSIAGRVPRHVPIDDGFDEQGKVRPKKWR